MTITATYAVKNGNAIDFIKCDLTAVRDFRKAAKMVDAAARVEANLLWARLAMRDYDSNGFFSICRNELVFTQAKKS